MKISADLIDHSARFTNCLKERELSLRGNKIPIIENLAITRDKYDTIDLSDNELRLLNNFPTLVHLKTLYCANNFISKLDNDLVGRLPNLETLVLTNNRLEDFESVANLCLLPKLHTLSLVDNVVCKRPNYRLFIISRCPNLKYLDFNKVTVKERQESAKLYPSSRKHTSSALDGPSSKRTKASSQQQLSSEHIASLKQLVMDASSAEEVDRLERIINNGILTDEVSKMLLNKQ